MKKAYFCFLLAFTLSVCPLVVSSADLGEGIDPQPPLEELPADEKSDESNDQADALSNNVSSEETQSETETETDSDTSLSETPEPEVEKTEKEKYLEFTKNILDNYEAGAQFKLYGYSFENYICLEQTGTSNYGLDDTQKDILYEMLAELYDVINENAIKISDGECWNYASKIVEKERELVKGTYRRDELVLFNYYCKISIDSDYHFTLYDNYISTPWGEWYTETPQTILSFLEAEVMGNRDYFSQPTFTAGPGPIIKKTVRSDLDLENGTYEGKEFQHIETLSFDITMDGDAEKTFLSKLAAPGETIHARIDQINTSDPDLFILTLEGSHGKKQFYDFIEGFSFSGETGNELDFRTSYVYENNELITDNTDVRVSTITFRGNSSDEQVTELTMSVKVPGIYFPFAIPVENMKYEYYASDNSVAQNRNLSVLFGLKKEEVMVPSNDQPQDLEHYVTEMRMVHPDGNVIDFYISFAAQAKINLSTDRVPEWYKKLGDNVNVTVVGVMQTLNGKDRMGYTMLKFSGDNDIQWFDLSSGDFSNHLLNDDYKKAPTLYADMTYRSMLSFNGFTKIENTIEYDTTKALMNFVNDGEIKLDNIVFTIGSHEVKVEADEFNYVGGGIVYEKLQ